MKRYNLILIYLFLALSTSCNGPNTPNEMQEHEEEGHHEEHIQLSTDQLLDNDILIGNLTLKTIGDNVAVTGTLEVPPQNQASVSAVIGGNISAIQVIEGQEVHKGDVLATLSHPSLIALQSNYWDAYNDHAFAKTRFERQKELYEQEASSLQTFQAAEAEQNETRIKMQGLESQLSLLGYALGPIQKGKFKKSMSIISPIDGHVQKVDAKTGLYVLPETQLFEIVNTHHVHADFMVFEKEVYKVKQGQKVEFSMLGQADLFLSATLYSVGKTYESNPKALHVHAEIDNKQDNLIPGAFIKGVIITDTTQYKAIPESGIVYSEGKQYVFALEKKDKDQCFFTPIGIKVDKIQNGWASFDFHSKGESPSQFVTKNAYYLLAEWKKSEAEHSH